jgi:hypothetical protein
VEAEDLIDLLQDLPDSILVSDNEFDKRDVIFLDKEDHIWDFADGLMLYAKKQGHIFKEEDQLYSGPDEMTKEFEDRYGKYLPDNFDIRSRLCYFAGAMHANVVLLKIMRALKELEAKHNS